MKIFYIDPNNDTPQINYPLVKALQLKRRINIYFITSFNRFGSRYYHHEYKIYPIYLFFKFENKISNQKIRRILKIITFPFNNIILLKKVIRNKPDIIHYNWLLIPLVDFIFIKIYKLLQIKIVLTQHNYIQHNKNNLRSFEKYIFNSVDKIVCLSEFVKTQFYVNGYKNVTKIGHGNCYESEISKFKSNLSVKNEKTSFNILFIGAIKPYKGIELLLLAMNDLINVHKCTDIYLYIAGYCEHKYFNRIKFNINKYNIDNHVIITRSFLNYEQMFEYVNNCDCGILPYIEATQSGLPYIFYSFKKPIIITNVGGLPEQTSDKISIVTLPKQKELSQSILNMKTSIEKGKYNPKDFSVFLSDNSWDKTINSYVSLYKEILK
ncbi:glycosyltransferase [bacterium]|nr:MAG: glycosyltransferase [bacterium]